MSTADETRAIQAQHHPHPIAEMVDVVAFPGDSDTLLKSIQAFVHFDLIRLLAMRARARYLAAADFLGANDELASWLRPLNYVPPLPLGQAYVIIASAYRFYHAGQSQMEFAQTSDTHALAVQSRWVQFFETETEAITEKGPITRAILEVCWGREASPGGVSQELLASFLEDRYGDLRRQAWRLQQTERWE